MSLNLRTAKVIWNNAYLSGGDNPYDEPSDEFDIWKSGIDARVVATEAAVKRRTGKRRKTRLVAVADFETDPPAPGRHIEPFAFGFFDGQIYQDYWGPDAADALVRHIRELSEEHVIYAHNGGKFDWQFIAKHLEREILFIGSRIVRAYIKGKTVNGKELLHEIRDSVSIIPVPLADAADKWEFDYTKMEAGKRSRYRRQIMDYLKQDCVELYRVVMVHRETFGPALTMASAAMKELNKAMAPEGDPDPAKFQVYERMRPDQDAQYRKWYFGGRVECFQKGIIHASPGKTLQIFDITGSYPASMKNCLHPVGASYEITRDITEETDFALIDATSSGCLPIRKEDGSLHFPHTRGQFHATIHEIKAGLDLGSLKIHRVLHARQCSKKTTFAAFIDKFFGMRQDRKQWCKDHGEDSDRDPFVLFWKLVQNGAYGKFSQNPNKFRDHVISLAGEQGPSQTHGWTPAYIMPEMTIWERPTEKMYPGSLARSFLNVGTGASITGASRAALLYGMAGASRLVYCDTDSLVCEGLTAGPRVLLDGSQLGGWKLEAEGDRIAICEKKLYAFFGERSKDDRENKRRATKYGDERCVKIASKGVALKASDILAVAAGEVITHHSLFPTLKPDGRQVPVIRRIKMSHVKMPDRKVA